MSTVEHGAMTAPSEEPDAVCRGWWAEPAGERQGALFMLAGTAMGVSVMDVATGDLARPEWVDLATVVHLDALGDPEGGVQTVELGLSTGLVRTAGWTGSFCDAVVDALHRLVEALAAAPASTQPPLVVAPADPPAGPFVADPLPPEFPAALVAPAPDPAPVTSPFAPAGPPAPVAVDPPAVLVTPLPEPDVAPVPDLPPPADVEPDVTPPPFTPQPTTDPVEPAAAPAGMGTSLVLEDVVYLGGHPSEAKKKKRCTATLTEVAVVVDGPGEMSITVPWSEVTSVEVQNSDEARFRMNLRVHRDASAVILTQHDGTKVLLEARDCPTIPLRSAVVQLLVDQPVEVV